MTPTSEETALYRVFGDADLLLYIGISKDFGSRWKKEAADYVWWPEKRWMTVRWYDCRPEAKAAEEAAIKAECPRYNIDHSVVPFPLPRCIVPTAPLVPRRDVCQAEIAAFPVAADLAFTARLLGIRKGYERALVRNRRFPCAVQNYGGTFIVRKVDLVASLGLGMDGRPLASSAAPEAEVA